MEEIRGPAGRTMWDKLANVQEEVLANYLKNEYPQTVAVVLSKIKAEHAARVLAHAARRARPRSRQRMLRMEAVQKDISTRRADAAHRVHVEPRADTRATRTK